MIEKQLINKSFYEQYLSDEEKSHPIRVLGESYLIEQKKEVPNLANIRFAQAEVYFHHHDFEAAIYKWEHIHNELEPWAKKNIADAFFKLELYQNAEEMYKSITSESVVLNTEIGLQLFSLYMEQGNVESACKVIKTVISYNPGYLSVTDMARSFFEEQHDWKNACELALNEAVRTKSIHWFDHLIGYIKNDHISTIAPAFFTEVLEVLFEVDRNRFEEFISLITKKYRKGDYYFSWIKTMNELFTIILKDKMDQSSSKISLLFKEIYYDLMNGRYLLKQLNLVIPDLLTNWVKIDDSIFASAIIMTWNEFFPTSLTTTTISEAELGFHHSKLQNVSPKEIVKLNEAIMYWADEREVEINRNNFKIDEQSQLNQEQIESHLQTMRKTLIELLARRAEMETSLTNTIERSAEMLSRVSGAVHQLEDLQDDKIKTIKKSFLKQKDDVKSEMLEAIPKLLRGCSDFISEENDFNNIDQLLNKEMNNRIQNYLSHTVLPMFREKLMNWIDLSKEELLDCQNMLNERSDGFNILFGEERINLPCDFQILEDWLRDAKRITSDVTVDNVNILLKFTPTQFLLRSAGKLFGSLSSNKTMVFNKYKSFIENENYEDATNEIISKFMIQFDLFEKSLQRDLKIFFKVPAEILNETVDEMKKVKQRDEMSLIKLKENPELFRDPVTIFELRVRQYEWMMVAGSYSNSNI